MVYKDLQVAALPCWGLRCLFDAAGSCQEKALCPCMDSCYTERLFWCKTYDGLLCLAEVCVAAASHKLCQQEAFPATPHSPTRCNRHSTNPAVGPRNRNLACHAFKTLQQVTKSDHILL